MRLVGTLSFAFIAVALGSAAQAVPPPPPPPLPADLPKEIGGYPTDAMNAVYQQWLRSQVTDAARWALDEEELKSYAESGGKADFLLAKGPRVSAKTAWGDDADYWVLDYVCPHPPAGSAVNLAVYIKSAEDRCGWMAIHADAHFSYLQTRTPDAELRPDFARLAELLRKTDTPKDKLWTAGPGIFASLGDVRALLKRAVKLQKFTARDCPALASVVEALDGKQLAVDVPRAGESRELASPGAEASIFHAELPIRGGEASLSDFGTGPSYESWQVVDRALGPCARAAASEK